ncbi:hypothetical protein AK812_SmicGene41628 [Symbiodinium microadriaticum]|uniref:Uncharacterized protein n=1 Tax=Symbiodinium microadriaticum TaxID=2951 RepID=A0A1Q9C5M1_SYMMI|nr:hypothetical protein AK812_SmicGene41628 [Symbiodinium microadriaticum]
MPVPSVKQSNALLHPPPLSLEAADGATAEPPPVKNGSTDDLAASAIEQKLRERLLQLHNELRRALDESWMKLIDSVESDLHQAYGGSDGKLSPWLSAEEKEPGHPGTASRASEMSIDLSQTSLDASVVSGSLTGKVAASAVHGAPVADARCAHIPEWYHDLYVGVADQQDQSL